MSTRQTNARLTRAKRKILPPGEKKKKTCAKEHLLCYMIQKSILFSLILQNLSKVFDQSTVEMIFNRIGATSMILVFIY
jgi:hypothetical protein